jgi:hypothetical protein
VPEGSYTYKIGAVDSLGNSNIEVVGSVTVGAVLSITGDNINLIHMLL